VKCHSIKKTIKKFEKLIFLGVLYSAGFKPFL